jgi:hypothetical protein
MEVLRVDTQDLTLVVDANGVEKAYARAQRKQAERLATCTTYTWTGDAVNAELYHVDNALMRTLRRDAEAPPVFFENKDYFFEIDLKAGVTDAWVHSPLKEVKDGFVQRSKGARLSGVINFGNDLGRSGLVVRYRRNGEPREFHLGFEVFSTKLDQQADLKRIQADIEREFPLLVLDVLRKTYSHFQVGTGPTSDLVWWQVFGGLHKEFIKASRFILNKPHSRLVKQERWERADRLKHLAPRLEEELAHWRHSPEHRYHTTHRSLSTDTAENRFFKYAVQQVARRYGRIKEVILKTYEKTITEEYVRELETVDRELVTLSNHPLFRSVGPFTGLRQESLVLQRATGYSTVYRNWIMLQRGFSLLEDLQRMETKNIADLYQIWCFLELKNIVEDLLTKKGSWPRRNGLTSNGLVLRLAEGGGSRLGFELDDEEVLELYHEFSIGDQYDLTTFTGPQRPDIALRIRKGDLKEDYVLTYLFDAKYRLHSDEKEDAPDVPPPDALNQMHRYRDAIYYLEKRNSEAQPEKEVIGGYILFPGEGLPEQVRTQPYFRSIEQVNIGAFPLRPGDDAQRKLLRDQVARIIARPAAAILRDIRPQKRMRYDHPDPIVLVAVAKKGAQQEYLLSGMAEKYHTGEKFPGRFADARLRYFAPYVGDLGLNCYFEILGYEVLPRDLIYPKGHPLHKAGDTSSRLVLHLGERIYINGGSFYPTDGGVSYFRYTKLSMLRAPRSGKVGLVLSEELDAVGDA